MPSVLVGSLPVLPRNPSHSLCPNPPLEVAPRQQWCSGSVERYSSGTSRPTVGQSPNGTSIFFPFPLSGMWEIRVQSKGGRAVTESFVGSGSSVSSAWGEYTVFTVSGYTGVSITVPPNMTAAQTYSLSAIFIGQPL